MTYLLAPIALFRLLKNFKPDVIHIEEDPHSLVALETICIASLTCPRTPISFFIWDNVNHKPRFPLNVIKRWLTRFSLSRAAWVVAGNRDAQALLGSQKNYHGPSNVLPQFGIDYAVYQGEPKPEMARLLAKQAGTPIIGYMGRLVSEKGILHLCQALEGLMNRPWKLVVVGAGPLQKDLEEQWRPRFGERMILAGPGARADLPDYLKCFDILVVPSYSTPAWKEQFGYIIVEAMAAGVAVIGSSSGAIPEVLGEAGAVFPEGDIPRLQATLARLMESSDERNRLSRLGRARAHEAFSHDAVSASYLAIFRQMSPH